MVSKMIAGYCRLIGYVIAAALALMDAALSDADFERLKQQMAAFALDRDQD